MKTFIDELTSNRSARIAAVAVLALLALFLLVKTWDVAFGRDVSDPYNTITVEGTGRAAMVPDTARITFTITESSANVADAQKKATDKTDSVLASLKDQDIDDRDVKTLSYNVSPRYEYNQRACLAGMICPPVTSSPTIVGYDVSQTIQVKVRETDKAGDVLASLGSLGVQNVNGPEFVVDDETAVQAEAREEAIAEARAKAKALAKDLGVHLGKIVSFYEGPTGGEAYGYGGKAMMDSAMAVPQAAPTLPIGENETETTVSITYEIR